MIRNMKAMLRSTVGERVYAHAVRLRNDFTLRSQCLVAKASGKPLLSTIGRYFGTDKVDEHHSFKGVSYLDAYEQYIRDRRRRPVTVLEIGVKGGASLRTWKAYFTKGKIYGVDIDPGCKMVEEPRIQVAIGSQGDDDFLRTCFGEQTKFDVIVDDGSHINSLTIRSFETLFSNRLNAGGIYILEDLRCSYEKLQSNHDVLNTWPGMKYNDPTQNYDNERQDMNDFFLDRIRNLDHLTGDVLFLHFWAMTCVIGKA